MQTLDPVQPTPSGALSSPAALRNAGPILEVLRRHLPARGRVLEVAAGSGEHAVAFAAALPGLHWTPSDPSPEARASIAAHAAASGLANLADAAAVDVLDPAGWPAGPFEVVACSNLTHISPWPATLGLMSLAAQALPRPGGLLFLYGPFREAGVALAASNAAFDESLRARDPAWGLRALEDVAAAARDAGLALTLRRDMPANNLALLFRRL